MMVIDSGLIASLEIPFTTSLESDYNVEVSGTVKFTNYREFEKNDKYDPYNKRNVSLLYKAFSAQADSINTEYSLNDSTWE